MFSSIEPLINKACNQHGNIPIIQKVSSGIVKIQSDGVGNHGFEIFIENFSIILTATWGYKKLSIRSWYIPNHKPSSLYILCRYKKADVSDIKEFIKKINILQLHIWMTKIAKELPHGDFQKITFGIRDIITNFIRKNYKED